MRHNKAEASGPWKPGHRQIDIRDLRPESLVGQTVMNVQDVIGIMDAAALTADLCLARIMKEVQHGQT